MALPQSIPPPLAGESSLKATRRATRHHPVSGRRFIGPMPTAVVDATLSPSRRQRLRREPTEDSSESSDSSDDDQIRDAIRAHAKRYYQNRTPDETISVFGEETEDSIRKEMHRRWRQTEWGQATHQRRGKAGSQTKKWLGTSFMIGEIPGLDIPERISSPPSSALPSTEATTSRRPASSLRASTMDTFVTARTELEPDTENDSAQSPMLAPAPDTPFSTSSTTALVTTSGTSLRRPTSLGTGLRPALRAPFSSVSDVVHSDTRLLTMKKGKRRTVHYEDDDSQPPAAPGEVLARTGSAVAETSAGAAEEASAENDVKWGEAIMQDRLMVRVSHSRLDIIGGFNEEKSRTARGVDSESWVEYFVIWRKDRLELYENYDNLIKGWFMKHKRLAHVISLKRSRTNVSMFSFADLSFCVTTEPSNADLKSGILHVEKEGTSIFVMKHRSRTRSADWYWELWRALGGTLPSIVEIRCPALDVSLKLDLPAHENWAMIYQEFSPHLVLEMCEEAISRLPNWKFLMETAIQEGDGGFELAWRVNSVMDWVTHEDDVDGHPRKWAALWGLALRQPGSLAHLEFRKAQHYATKLHLKDGTSIEEPPAIEGYLDRIRTNSQTRNAQYVSTHDSVIVFATHVHAYAPAPPGTSQRTASSASTHVHSSETRRGAQQMLHADGLIDMRSVVLVRRAFQVTIPKGDGPEPATQLIANAARSRPPWETDDVADEPVEETDSDDEDVGGEDVITKLGAAAAKAQLRMRRSFELVLVSGQVIRLEAHSRRLAIEWITRLRDLIRYWRQRHHIDAREEMDICEATKPPVTPHMHSHLKHSSSQEPPTPPLDPDATTLALGTLYHWCVLDGCRSIIRSGKVFVRKGLRGQYQNVLLVLTAGHIVQFSIKPNSSFQRRRKGPASINLAHAYVVSGPFAAQALSKGEYDPNQKVPARRYADGLEVNDAEEDTLFVLWYRPTSLGDGLDDAPIKTNTTAPSLSVKKRTVVFRTRSKLERDNWVWALNTEIERYVRLSRALGEPEVDVGNVALKGRRQR